MSERQIDSAIDDAVRDLMSVDADPAFRARVAARLRERSPRGGHWRQLLAASAAVAALIIAAVLFRGTHEPAMPRAIPTGTTSTDGQKPVPRVAAPGLIAPLGTPSPGTRRIAARPQMRNRNVTQEIPRASLLAAVADVSDGAAVERGSFRPIDIEPIAAPAITPPELMIAPLAPISQIVIAPFDSPIGRN